MSKKKSVITAAIIVIGDEILSGRTTDKNVPYLATKLNDVGIQLKQVHFVEDSEADIVAAVNSLRAQYSYVFTTGGIGPTHDDITAACIAKAFGKKIARHPDALERLRLYYEHEDFNEARKKMADMPQGVALIDNPVSVAPGFIIENVYVMAGVPQVMQAMFDTIIDTLESGVTMKSKTITCHFREGEVGPHLRIIQDTYEDVKIGSYPFFRAGLSGVSIVLRGANEITLQRAIKDVRDMVDTLKKDMAS